MDFEAALLRSRKESLKLTIRKLETQVFHAQEALKRLTVPEITKVPKSFKSKKSVPNAKGYSVDPVRLKPKSGV